MSCRYLAGDVEAEPTVKTKERAQLHLTHFYAVVLFENFATEAAEFAKVHGIPAPEIPTERKAKYPDPTPAEAGLIRHYNALDIALYEEWKANR